MHRISSNVVAPSVTVGTAAAVGMTIASLSLAAIGLLIGALVATGVASMVLASAGPRLLVAGLIAAATATMAANRWRLSGSVAVSDAILVAAALALGVALLSSSTRRDLRPYAGVVGGAALIVAGGMLGSLASPNLGASVEALARFALAAVVLPLLVALWSPGVSAVRRISWVWVAAVGTSAALAIVGTGTSAGAAYARRENGLTLHPNHLAVTCVLALGPALALSATSKPLGRWTATWAIVLLGSGILVSGSRSGILGAAVAVGAYLALTRGRATAGRLLVGGCVVWVISLSGAIEVDTENVVARLRNDNASSIRSDATRQASLRADLDRAMEHPITGAGFDRALNAHNVWLQSWSSAGVLGVAGFATVVVTTTRRVWRARIWRGGEPIDPDRVLLIGLGAGYLGFLAVELFQNVLWERFMWLFPPLIVALATGIRRDDAPPTPPDPKPASALVPLHPLRPPR